MSFAMQRGFELLGGRISSCSGKRIVITTALASDCHPLLAVHLHLHKTAQIVGAGTIINIGKCYS
jgi:hypothetical protein